MSEDRCVICGAYVPEGRMICPSCESWKKSVPEDNWKRALEYCDNDVQAMKDLIDGRFRTPLITYGSGYTPPITFGTEITKDACPMCKRSFKDFVKVVRCKDCTWSNDDCSECMNPNLALGGDYASCLYIDPNWFCADGVEKKEEKPVAKWHEIISADDLPNFCRTVLVELRSGDRQVAQLDINPWTRVPGWLIPNGEWIGPIDIVKRWMEIAD